MAEEPKPQEETPQPDEKEPDEKSPKKGEPGEGPQPEVVHIPIDCAIVNLHHLDAVAFQRRTGRPIIGFQDTDHEGIGGTQFLVTLKLTVPVRFPEPPLTVDVRYFALHDGSHKSSGLFLYKQTDSVTFRADAPDNGGEMQQFMLQTIRFTPELAAHEALVTIEPHHQGHYVGKKECKFTLKPGP